MTPTREEALAEMERRKENRRRKTAGEQKISVPASDLTKASADELKQWAGQDQ